MPTPIVRFEPQHMPAVRRFVEKTWQRPTSDAFYRWRYLDAPLLEGHLALRHDGEVLATLWTFRRPWRVGDRTLELIEVFDWYALPEMRRAGLGVRALQAAMKGPDPCILVGGSEDTQSLLPRLKWKRVATAERFLLPLRADRVAPTLAERTPLPAAAARPVVALLARTWFRPRRRGARGRVLPVAEPGPEALSILEEASGWGTVPLWPAEHLRWLQSAFAGAGAYLPLYFARGESLLGFAILRLYPTSLGCDAELIELAAREPEPDLHTWMVSEIAVRARAFGAGLLATSTACPTTQEALRRNRFLRFGEVPIHVYSRPELEMPGPFHVHSNTNDNPLIPGVESWFEARDVGRA